MVDFDSRQRVTSAAKGGARTWAGSPGGDSTDPQISVNQGTPILMHVSDIWVFPLPAMCRQILEHG